ncbi:MAG TPA: glycosyltransferase family 2 protein, partial [Dissulfurispiraceae bacterium]
MSAVAHHHICVCVCTYRRQESLGSLLSELTKQDTGGYFDYSIVIVDNDRRETARHTAESFARQSGIPSRYYVEPEQNIALARNKTIENAGGEFVALIDDDEFPHTRWLLNLYKTLDRYKADGVLGPVLPHFEKEPPRWILKGRFFDRPSHPTGHVLQWQNTRTGNALLKRELFQEGGLWFNPDFGSGGEDRDFFRRKIEEDRVFVWCNEAPVFEVVPPRRWERTVLLKRALLRGKMALNSTGPKSVSVLKSLLAIVL